MIGRVVARTLPDGTTTRYVYDATCALADVHHGEQRVSRGPDERPGSLGAEVRDERADGVHPGHAVQQCEETRRMRLALDEQVHCGPPERTSVCQCSAGLRVAS